MDAVGVRFEFRRQLFHLLFGVGLALVVWAFGEKAWVVFASAFFVGLLLAEGVRRGLYLPVVSECLAAFERANVHPGKGVLLCVFGAFVTAFLFSPRTAFVALLVLAYSDSFSTLVGVGCGRTRIFNGKSVEGGVAAFVAGAGVSLLFLPVVPALGAAVAAAVVEVLSSSPLDDNITVPVAAGAVIYILAAA